MRGSDFQHLPYIVLSMFISFQSITTSGFRICVKELYVQRFDPLNVSYAVMGGKQKIDLLSFLFLYNNQRNHGVSCACKV